MSWNNNFVGDSRKIICHVIKIKLLTCIVAIRDEIRVYKIRFSVSICKTSNPREIYGPIKYLLLKLHLSPVLYQIIKKYFQVAHCFNKKNRFSWHTKHTLANKGGIRQFQNHSLPYCVVLLVGQYTCTSGDSSALSIDNDHNLARSHGLTNHFITWQGLCSATYHYVIYLCWPFRMSIHGITTNALSKCAGM